ncbi:Exocyst complex component 1 [Rhizophlyctis rosea]|nr:Exocyst complex component 1 [Rhizophlyctis rosea]
MTDAQLRQNLTTQLFAGLGDASGQSASTGRSSSNAAETPSDRYNEKLLQQWRVKEEKKSDGSAGGMGRSNSDDDIGIKAKGKNVLMQGKKSGGGKTALKVRYVCITVKKNMKIRIHKVKEKGGVYSIGKSWGLDDIKSIESSSSDDTLVTINLGKLYKWYLDDAQKKVEFMYTLLKLCRRYLKRLPKLINVDEDSLKNQMQLDASYLSATEKTFTNTFATFVQRPRGVNFEEEEEGAEQAQEEPEAEPEQPLIDLDEVLEDFNWQASGNAADLEARLTSELQALEAANVYAIIQSEEQANIVVEQLENAILQLDQIDEWLVHYTHLLDSMGQDVHQIEIRNKGMQIASANQHLLLKEVDNLLGSLRLPGFIVEILRNEPLDDLDGVSQCEEATDKLSDIVQRKFDEGVGNMQAVKERIALYNGYGNQFAIRLHDYLLGFFHSQAEVYLQDKSRTSKKGSLKLYGHETIEENCYRFRKLLRWLKEMDTRKHYDLQMIYVQEMNRVYKREIREFVEQLRTHHVQRKAVTDNEEYLFTQQSISVSSAASNVLKSAITRTSTSNLSPTGSAPSPMSGIPHSASFQNKLSTTQSPSSGTWQRRRQSVKGSIKDDSFGSKEEAVKEEDENASDDDDSKSTLGEPSWRGHRRGPSESYAAGKPTTMVTSLMSLEVGADERMLPDEAFSHALSMLVPVMVREQNFISDLFSLHARARGMNSSQMDLSPNISTPPVNPLSPVTPTPAPATTMKLIKEWQSGLDRPRDAIKDVKAQKRLHELVEDLFSDVRDEMLVMTESALKGDPTFAVSMMVRIESYFDDLKPTGHTFVVALLDGVYSRLRGIFEKFVDEQIKAIDETKVTSKKRSGILSFVRTFPRFVDRIERYLPMQEGPTRAMADKAYAQIVAKMFETLEEVGQQVAADRTESKSSTDDKEFLNIHILNVENMHHLYTSLRTLKVPSLVSATKQSKTVYEDHLSEYCKVVIRKPLGKLYDFFEAVDALIKTGQSAPEEVAYNISYNKAACKDVVKKYPGKEIKKGLEALYKRVDKHFPDEEGLLQVVWRGIQEEFMKRTRRYEDILAQCYRESGIKLEFTMDELLGYFSELARTH